MVKKATGNQESKNHRKELHPKRTKLKHLHHNVGQERAELQGLPPDKLPPASSSNAARQVRSRLNMTFPVDWQELHLKKAREENQGDE